MSKRWKKIPVFLLSILLITAILPVNALAAGKIDTDRPNTLTIHYKNGGNSVSGAQFDLYRVADVDAYAAMTLTESFAQLKDKVSGLSELEKMESDEDWRALASTLKSCADQFSDAVIASKATDDDGNLVFENLTPGLYLLIGSSRTIGNYIYSVDPFMVFLPGADRENNDWTYDYNVPVELKSSRSDVPSDDGTVTRKVLKVWKDDKGAKRPNEVTVQLLRNGKVYDTVTLNEKNEWRYTWENLSDRYEWSVTEKNIPVGYRMNVERSGVTFVITNTYSPEPPPTPPIPPQPPLPQTGLLWWPVPLLLCLGMVFLIIGAARRRGEKE